MKARITIALVAAFALAIPAAAVQAAQPNAKSTLIVPNKSLGGVKLGSSLAAAEAAWGKNGTCTASGCTYTTSSGKVGSASFLLAALAPGARATVVSVSVEAGLLGTATKLNFNSPLDRFRTVSGIGIGSTVKRLRHAYPHLIKETGASFYTLKGPGEGFTGFDVVEGRVASVHMQSVHLG